MSRRTRNIILGILGLGIIGFVIFQIIPGGSINADFANPGNPPVTYTIKWDSPETEKLARAACFDCHSNETVWPAYAYVAPISWFVAHDVNDGREHLNFSEWDRPQGEADDVVEAVRDGSMPPLQYKPLHSGARLSDAQRAELVRGLEKTLAADPPIPGRD